LINGNPVSWQSKKQSTVALSSTEAEYYAMTEAVREALFVRQWFNTYCPSYFNQDSKMSILCDNQATIQLADHNTDHNRTKHIDIRHHFIRETIRTGFIELSDIRTIDQLADILTKPLDFNVFNRLLLRLYPNARLTKGGC
jgi:hypothetical protein